MSHQASKHPLAKTRRPHTVEEVLAAPRITPQLTLLECARRMDGAGAIIVASSRFLEKRGLLDKGNSGAGDVVILSGGEASGPLSPPQVIDETMFSCEQAAQAAYNEAQVRPDEMDFFGLYDCFRTFLVCLVCFAALFALLRCGMVWYSTLTGGGGREGLTSRKPLQPFAF